ncbi:hypothetical protein [Sphingopyxis sp. RIFCSPHIGHO2_12_FULL_65_19]|uniref:hypothetical protein n=1 Tax=Sphingopyxis sp. RIFCSPHIGHO2_12_FULL_65_19 TaxID=1802172 RepID=UPI0008B5ACDB|nr:hypothetical protein [Sphingopyxis sp. RIFCSPHIGHO2_12_FULL_65_19]OHD06269.1 MAG: hypothetical protein A3E77_13175 [Sphingopyxis sp. RIFCSPHIGHO2_12_FULL_65_19]
MLTHDPQLFNQLAATADAAVCDVLDRGGARTPRACGEVSAVRALTLDGFDAIAAAWTPLLRPTFHRLELTAIFTHSRPHVRYTPVRYTRGTGRCELADLLIVIDHQDYGGTIDDRRAVLVQAKRCKKGQIKLSGPDWTQYELLADLPQFTFVDSSYDPRPRDLKGMPLIGDPSVTAEYGGVDLALTPRRWSHWLPARPNGFQAEIRIGQYLSLMAMGGGYCGREAEPGGNDDWSFTVDELLRVTGALPIVQSAPGVLRQNSNVIGFIHDAAPYLSVPRGLSAGGPEKPEEDEYWPEGPISVAHLTLRQDEKTG